MAYRVIAESGGSKTDWCQIHHREVVQRFRTIGMHPDFLTDEASDALREELQTRMDLGKAELYFYGAGCHNPIKAEVMKHLLLSFGFRQVEVYSDLIAAGKAAYGSDRGWVAILGTGSVLVEYDDGVILNVYGGKGHLTGDEGSGYYFGKLVIHAWAQGTLDERQEALVESYFDKQELVNALNDGMNKRLIASLSEVLNPFAEFDAFHKNNLSCFLHTLDVASLTKKIILVGSYAFHHKELVTACFKKDGIVVLRFVKQPIEDLIEQSVASVE